MSVLPEHEEREPYMTGQSNCTKPVPIVGEQPSGVDGGMTIIRLETATPSSDSPPPTAPLGNNSLEGRYVFTGLHASGGIGRVWLARDRQLDREVAIKELFPDKAGNAKIAARFIREAQLTGQLEHPGVVPVYELASRTGTDQPFYAMKFVRGRTLTSAVGAYHSKRAQGGADSLEFVALLTAFTAVSNTIAYAHSRGVLHRDLKGANVILGDFGEVIVLDWGLAKLLGQPEADRGPGPPADTQDPGLTVEGEIVGTPAYMAPEQAEGRLEQIDQRTDIFGLGAILYEILAGQPPFTGLNTLEVLQKAIRGSPAPPREFWPEVPVGLEEICLKAMAKDPAQRYASAADLAHEVQHWQEVQRRRAEEALRASEEQYHSLADFIPGIVWTAGPDGSIDFANQFWLDFTGLTLEQTQGSGWIAIVHPDDVPRVAQLWTQSLQSGEPIEVKYRLKRAADGVYRWFLARAKAHRNQEGRIVKWFGILTEIEDQKQGTSLLPSEGTLEAGTFGVGPQ
jgi:PAS domain S-box-containing protein